MTKGSKMAEKSLDTQKNVSNTVKDTVKRLSVGSWLKKALFIGALGYTALAVPDTAVARGREFVDLVQSYAQRQERTVEYRKNHPSDTLIGLDDQELQDVVSLKQRFPSLDAQSAYFASREEPVTTTVYRGQKLENAIMNIVKGFPAFEHASKDAKRAITAVIIDSMEQESGSLDDLVHGKQKKDVDVVIPQSGLVRGFEIISGSAPGTGSYRPSRTSSRVSDSYDDSDSDETVSEDDSRDRKVKAKHKKGKKQKKGKKSRVERAEDSEDSDVTLASADYEMPSCEDAVGKIKKTYTKMMKNKRDEEDVAYFAEESFAGIEADCPAEAELGMRDFNSQLTGYVCTDLLSGKVSQYKAELKNMKDSGDATPSIHSAGLEAIASLEERCISNTAAAETLSAERAALESDLKSYFTKKLDDFDRSASEMIQGEMSLQEITAFVDQRYSELSSELAGYEPVVKGQKKPLIAKSVRDFGKALQTELDARKNALKAKMHTYECEGKPFNDDIAAIVAATEAGIASGEDVAILSGNAEAAYSDMTRRCGSLSAAAVTASKNEQLAKLKKYECSPAQLTRDAKGIRSNADSLMSQEAPLSEVDAAVTATGTQYDSLKSKCQGILAEGATQAVTQIEEARSKLNIDHVQYDIDQNNKLTSRATVVVGAEHSIRSITDSDAIGAPSGDVDVLARLATAKDATNPKALDAYLNVGDFVQDRDGAVSRMIERPHGGAVISMEGKDYGFEASAAGEWHKQRSESTRNSAVNPEPIVGADGSITTERTSESAHEMSRTDRVNTPENASGSIAVHKKFNGVDVIGGLSYERSEHHETIDTDTNSSTSQTVVLDQAGPPVVSVNTQAGADTAVNTRTIADVVSDTIVFKAGAQFGPSEGGIFSGGATVLGSYSNTRAKTRTTIDTAVNPHDTVVDVCVDGVCNPSDVTPGSSGPAVHTESKTKDKDKQGSLVLLGNVTYDVHDVDGNGMFLQLRGGPSLYVLNKHKMQFSDMPVQGNATALFNAAGLDFGGNIVTDGNYANLHLVVSNYNFNDLVDYISRGNQLNVESLIDSKLKERYKGALLDAFLVSGEGPSFRFLVDGGLRVAEGKEGAFDVSAGVGYQTSAGFLGLLYDGEIRKHSQEQKGQLIIPVGNGFHISGGVSYEDRSELTNGRDVRAMLELIYKK